VNPPLVVTVGSVNIDLISHARRLPMRGETLPGEGFSILPGGKGANQALRVALSGGRSAFVGKRGADVFGPLVLDYLASGQVDTEYFGVVDSFTGMSQVVMEADGNYASVINAGANGFVTAAEVDRALPLLRRADAILLQLEIPLATLEHTLALARELKLPVYLNAAPAQKLPASFENAIEVLIVNEVEAEMLTGTALGADFARLGDCAASLRRYARNIVISLGASGVFALAEDGGTLRLAGHSVVARCAIGAGDSFIGELIVRHLGGATLFQALKYANAAAAIVIGSPDGLRHRIDPQALEALVSASAAPA